MLIILLQLSIFFRLAIRAQIKLPGKELIHIPSAGRLVVIKYVLSVMTMKSLASINGADVYSD